jgi:hypothetical protein
MIGRWMLAIVIVALCVGGTYFGYREVSSLNRLRTVGKQYEGVVEYTHESSGKSHTYQVNYRFEANGNIIFDSDKIDKEMFDSLVIGGPIVVTALPDDTATHVAGVVTTQNIDGLRNQWFWGTFLLVVFAGACLLQLEVQCRQERSVLTTWMASPAFIDDISAPSKGRYQTCDIAYRYRGNSGEAVSRTDQLSALLAGTLKLGQWTTVLVAPDDDAKARLLVTLSSVEVYVPTEM